MRIGRFTIFITTLLLLLYITNLVVYEALASIFELTTQLQLFLLGLGLGVLSGSFIVASIVGSYFYNWGTRVYYTLSAVWIGFFVYLFFASALYGIVVGITGVLLPQVGVALIGLAVAVSIYGVLHARKIYIQEVEVALQNLPAQWKGRKAVWVSDLHLGQLHGPSFAKRVVDMINALPHDIVFIGGDLYDGTGAPDIEELALPLGKCKAPLGVYYITGNHEEYGDSERFLKAIRAAGIRTLIDEMVAIDGLQLIGVDYRNASNTDAFEKILAGFSIDSGKPSILLKHEPKDLAVAEKAGISLQISGHTHRGQQWPFEYIARFVYKGYAYGLKRFKNMQVYVSSGTGTWGPPLRVRTNCEIVVFIFM